MYNCEDQKTGIDWARIFKERPDLSPPGYSEMVKSQSKSQKGKTNARND